MVKIEGVKDSIATKPFIAGDGSITVHVIEHEDLLNGMTESFAPLQFSESMGQLMLKGFDRFAETFDAFTELVRRHTITRHHRVEAFAVDMNLRFGAGGIGRIQFLSKG